jgi:putative ABC transport system substrate-binding protein
MTSRTVLSTSIAVVAALSLGLAGCSGPQPTTPNTPITTAPTTATTPTTQAPEQFLIASAVIVAHPSLQAAQDGFEEVLKENNIDYELITDNAQGEGANATTIASSYASNPDIDLILAISTPIAQAIAQAEKDRPILFTAVTDPVDAGLVPSWDQAGANITGTSDLNPEARPVELVTEAMPDAKTIGVLYSSSEANSLVQVQAYKDEAGPLGVTIKEQGITSGAEISVGLEALADVDAILVPTDNNVVAALASVISYGQEHSIPIFTADATSVEQGTVASRGFSYFDMGRATGEMAVQILRDGVDISTIAPIAPTETELFINPNAALTFGLTLPDDFLTQGTIVETKTS